MKSPEAHLLMQSATSRLAPLAGEQPFTKHISKTDLGISSKALPAPTYPSLSPPQVALERQPTTNVAVTFDLPEYQDPNLINIPRRPSVQRTASMPQPDTNSSSMFVPPSNDLTPRPPLPRACSESHATGVLERRRKKALSENSSVPLRLILDLQNLPLTIGTSNINLLQAARRAAFEPMEWDWGFSSCPQSQHQKGPSSKSWAKSISTSPQQAQATDYISAGQSIQSYCRDEVTASEWIGGGGATATSTTTTPAAASERPTSTRTTTQATRKPNASYEFDSEWDWAIAGHARASADLYQLSRARPNSDARLQFRFTNDRRSSVDHEADGSGSLSAIGGGDSMEMTDLLSCYLPDRRGSKESEAVDFNDSLARRPRPATCFRSLRLHATTHKRCHSQKSSLHLPLTLPSFEMSRDFQSTSKTTRHHRGSSPFVGAREHALGTRRSRSVERNSFTFLGPR